MTMTWTSVGRFQNLNIFLYFDLVDPVMVDDQQKEEPRVVVSNTQDAYMGDDEEITIEVRLCNQEDHPILATSRVTKLQVI